MTPFLKLSSFLDGTSLNGNEVVYTKIVHLKKKTALFCYVQARAFENTVTYEKFTHGMAWLPYLQFASYATE